jgi:O-antigen ligase
MIVAKAAFYLTCASAISILFSIAISQVLLGLAVAALLVSGARMEFPPIKLPLAIYMVWTLLAVLLSSDPRTGTPQIRKLVVFFILLLVTSTFRSVAQVRGVVLIWGCVAGASALRSFYQFWLKYQQARELHKNFYDYYVSERITGFTSHWMTFGGEEMIVLLMLLSFLFFSRPSKWKTLAWSCVAILGVSLVLGWTRSIFLLGFPLGACYLIWFWKRWFLLLAPAALAVALLVAPLRERILSVFQPHGDTDSNMHRTITRRTGWQMVKAHPLFGLGPEVMKDRPLFESYVPADIPRPLVRGSYIHLHNMYLQYPAERGIPALLALLWMIGKMVRDFVHGLRRRDLDPETRFVLHGAIAVIIGILAEGFYEYNLGDSEVLTMFLIAVGFGYVTLKSSAADSVK